MSLEKIEEAILNCRNQDRSSQKIVYEHFYGLVLSITKKYCGSIEQAKEVANDVFYRVFTKIDQYKPNTNFAGWISKIAFRVTIDYLRSECNTLQLTSEEHLPDIVYRSDIEIINKLDIEDKIKAIQKLTPAYRLVFNLYVIEQYTHEEISKELGISVGASKSNLSKARKQLSQILAYEYY